MKTIKGLCLLLLWVTSSAFAQEHVIWDKTPILIDLPLGAERIISFEESVSFSYDQGRLQDKLQVGNTAGTLYLKAFDDFDTSRVEVKLQSGKIILLDLQTSENAPTSKLSILTPKPRDTMVDAKAHRAVGYVALTRYAIQQLYAPKRVLQTNKAIKRVPMQTTRLVALYPLEDVKAMPLASFKDASHYVTAVMLRNQSGKSIKLHPKDLRGDFKAVAFYPEQRLKPKGDALDSVTVFIVTEKPFAMSL